MLDELFIEMEKIDWVIEKLAESPLIFDTQESKSLTIASLAGQKKQIYDRIIAAIVDHADVIPRFIGRTLSHGGTTIYEMRRNQANELELAEIHIEMDSNIRVS